MSDEQQPSPKPKKKRRHRANPGGKRGAPKGSRQRASSEYGTTPLEERFAVEYDRCRNYADAAKAAGSKATSRASLRQAGYDMFHTPQVQALLRDLHGEAEQEAKLTRAEILQGMRRNARLAEQEKQHATAVRAWELMGRDHELFGDKLHIRVQNGIGELLESARRFMKPETYVDLCEALDKAVAAEGVDQAAAEAGGEPGSVH